MCQFVETIRIEGNKPQDLLYHNLRYNRTRKMVFGINEEEDLLLYIQIAIKDQHLNSQTKYKVRVCYRRKFESIEIRPYRERRIESIKIVYSNTIQYDYKSTDRSSLDSLFEQRGNADDIIICKNGLVTDSWAANLAFFNGVHWVTPKTPLLRGTKRECLLDQGVLITKDIPYDSLHDYKKVRLINAMYSFDKSPEIPIKKITFSHLK